MNNTKSTIDAIEYRRGGRWIERISFNPYETISFKDRNSHINELLREIKNLFEWGLLRALGRGGPMLRGERIVNLSLAFHIKGIQCSYSLSYNTLDSKTMLITSPSDQEYPWVSPPSPRIEESYTGIGGDADAVGGLLLTQSHPGIQAMKAFVSNWHFAKDERWQKEQDVDEMTSCLIAPNSASPLFYQLNRLADKGIQVIVVP